MTESRLLAHCTKNAQKIKFSIKDLLSKCDQIPSFLRIWSHLLKKSLMENFIFCAVVPVIRSAAFFEIPSTNKFSLKLSRPEMLIFASLFIDAFRLWAY